MNLLQRFIEFIEQHELFSKADGLLIAVSGGIDSVVLCHLCKLAGYQFAIAHCNFGLRDQESHRDELFVQDLAHQLGVPFFINRFDTKAYAAQNKLSIQVAARELRYKWFQEVVKKAGEPSDVNPDKLSLPTVHQQFSTTLYIATAHHLDDNIETVLMNLFKGTGISGLHGILPKSGNIVRPLLFAKREEIVAFAKDNQLQWVEDSSNAETKYTRNFIRHEIIPAISKLFPAAKENVYNSIQRFQEAEVLYGQAVQLHKKKLLTFKGDEVYIPVLKLGRTVPLNTIIYEIIKDFGFTSHQAPEVAKLLSSENGRYVSSSTHRVLRNRAWLIITPLAKIEEAIIVIGESTTQQSFAGGELRIQLLPVHKINMETDASIALLDRRDIQFPLLLRKCKEGDYFYPLGMRKKKKLARFFIDNKLSQIQKENVWVVESNKRILWIVGYRIDDRFKIDAGTQDVLRIECKPK